MADEVRISILLKIMMTVKDLVKERTVASEIERRIQRAMERQFTPNETPKFRAVISTMTTIFIEKLLQSHGYQAGNPPNPSIHNPVNAQLPPEGRHKEAGETGVEEGRRKSILLAVLVEVKVLVKLKTGTSEIERSIQKVLEREFNPNDSPEFRAAVSTEATVIVATLLQDAGYQSGKPPNPSTHNPMNAQLPPEKPHLEVGETGSEGERKKSILLAVLVAVQDLVKLRTVTSEIEMSIQKVLECQFNPNDSPEFRAAVSTEAALLVRRLYWRLY